MKCKVYNYKEIQEFTKKYDLSIPKLSWRDQQKRDKKLKKIGIKKRLTRIQKCSINLKCNTPKSEIWFQSLWPYNDLYNEPLGKYIPDVMNKVYKYVIEVDGSVHNTYKQQKIDIKKNKYYDDKGYQIFRVIAYDINSYNITLQKIQKIRNE